jgi:N-acetylglucosamine-6-phosphate deacetylase
MKQTLAAKNLVTRSGVLENPLVTIEAGRIVDIRDQGAGSAAQFDFHFPDATLTPGFLDIHFHGIAGEDVMHTSPDGFQKIARILARAGVTSFLPTTVTASLDVTLHALERMAEFVAAEPVSDGAQAIGIHIEGPFLSAIKRGMHPAEHLLAPSAELLDRFWQAAKGQIRLMTIAPELPGSLETIAHATALGIRCSIGHSVATRAEALAGIGAGAVTATHTFNAMRPLDHREPGILGVVLDRDELYADLICDGYHVAPEAVRLWLKAKGPERAILITDCLSAAGMPDGRYMAGDTVVHVQGAACRTDAGVIAGSVITLDQAVVTLRSMTGASLAIAARLAAINPAAMLGLPPELSRGSVADFNVYDVVGCRRHTIVRGLLIH